jgi:hypothetical protein
MCCTKPQSHLFGRVLPILPRDIRHFLADVGAAGEAIGSDPNVELEAGLR